MKLILAAALAASFAAPALAVSTVDVDNLLVGQGSRGRVSGTPYAGGIMQSWTVGTSGQLTRIDMLTAAYTNSAELHPEERATLQIYDVSGLLGSITYFDLATATLKGQLVMPLNAVRNGGVYASVQSIDLSSLNVTAYQNQQLAFRMVVTCPNCASESYWVNYTSIEYPGPNIRYSSDGYNGGAMLYNYSGDGDAYATSYTQDLNFRTWMDTSVSVAPEPASWAMLIAGFGLVGGTMRRQRRSAASLAD